MVLNSNNRLLLYIKKNISLHWFLTIRMEVMIIINDYVGIITISLNTKETIGYCLQIFLVDHCPLLAGYVIIQNLTSI